MIEIKDNKHISVIIESLVKSYKKAKINGILKVKEIYYLNIIKRLLDNDNLTLTNDENNLLINIYNNLAFNSQQVCPPKIYKSYQTTPRIKFEQAEVDDCNTYPHSDKIFYWQEEDKNTLLADIQPIVDDTGYLVDKLFDTFANFEAGIEINYNKIGRIAFLAMESDTLNYSIKDVYNNDVTDAFDIVLIPTINSTLIVSKNFYSHGNINFKIKKL